MAKKLTEANVKQAFLTALNVVQEMIRKDGPQATTLWMTGPEAQGLLQQQLQSAPDIDTAINQTLNQVCSTNMAWMLARNTMELELLKMKGASNPVLDAQQSSGGGPVAQVRETLAEAVKPDS